MNNTYKCFWNGMEMDIYANSSYGAQQLATAEFQKVAGRKKVKGYDIGEGVTNERLSNLP